MDNPNDLIEQQLFTLLRRNEGIYVRTASGAVELDRSSYAILCLLEDEGPQRLGSIARAFHLDPSTITRQAQAVERLGLAEKTVDPSDRRAFLLNLTEQGSAAVIGARDNRRNILDIILNGWTQQEREEFLTALSRFNDTVDGLIESRNQRLKAKKIGQSKNVG